MPDFLINNGAGMLGCSGGREGFDALSEWVLSASLAQVSAEVSCQLVSCKKSPADGVKDH